MSPGILPVFQKMSSLSNKYTFWCFLPTSDTIAGRQRNGQLEFFLCLRHCVRKYAKRMMCLHNVIIDGKISHVHLPLVQRIHHHWLCLTSWSRNHFFFPFLKSGSHLGKNYPQKVWMGFVFVFRYHSCLCCKQKKSSHILLDWGMECIIILGKLTLTNMLVS